MKLDGRRDFHEARWDEPILMEMGAPGQRAILTEAIEPQVAQAVGSPTDRLPAGYRRAQAPKLPELGQMSKFAGDFNWRRMTEVKAQRTCAGFTRSGKICIKAACPNAWKTPKR